MDELSGFPRKVRRQLIAKIERLSENPTAGPIKRLHGEHREYLRLRSGDYRIWFYISGPDLLIVKVINRSDGYD